MKRDMDLVRRLLLAIEENDSGFAPRELKVEGYTEEQIGYHAHLMIQGGLVNGADVTVMGSTSPQAMVSSMTWAVLDSARDEKRWSEARGLLDKIGGATFTVWTNVLSHLVLKNLGIP